MLIDTHDQINQNFAGVEKELLLLRDQLHFFILVVFSNFLSPIFSSAIHKIIWTTDLISLIVLLPSKVTFIYFVITFLLLAEFPSADNICKYIDFFIVSNSLIYEISLLILVQAFPILLTIFMGKFGTF